MYHPQQDLLQQSGSRQPLCAHSIGRQIIAFSEWHMTKSFHQYAAQLKQQIQHRHMFTHWEVNSAKLASRVLFQRPAHYVPETVLRQHVQERVFPDRRLRRRTPTTDRVAFQATCNELRLLAAGAERANPVSFAIGNSWNDTLRADKQHYLEYTARSQT